MIVRIALAGCLCAFQADGPLVHSMDDLKVRLANGKVHAETVEGKVGKAVKFSFDDGCQNAFAMTPLRGAPEWDAAAGFSFWVKGDGSGTLGGLQLIWNEDYAARYDVAFPIDGTGWRKVVIPWRDLVPVLPGPKPLDPKGAFPPSKLSDLWFGKWWYWREYKAHAYAIDELRLEPRISLDVADTKPAGAPLARVLEKLKAGKAITVVTMGDSLTDFNHWANKPVNWPTLLTESLRRTFKSTPTLVNPAIGGTQLRQNLVLIPRWLAATPEPDLVTVCFGYNDWDAGMRGEAFREACIDAVDRIRRATKGKSDVLLITTAPALERWTTMSEMAHAVRNAAADRNAGLADTEKAFHAAVAADREKLFCRDKVHLGPAGHEVVARTVLETIERAGK